MSGKGNPSIAITSGTTSQKLMRVTKPDIIPIEEAILTIRGHRVLLDADLARIYGVTTKQLNQQVKRNQTRFPEDFMFQLTSEEKIQVVTICDHLRHLKYSSSLPYAFTEHGAVMLASVLNSRIAIEASLQVVRTFVRLRRILTEHKDLISRLEQLERKYDAQFKIVFDAIRQLMTLPEPTSKRRIGFRQSKESNVSDRRSRAKGS